jgi:hypothetical protein
MTTSKKMSRREFDRLDPVEKAAKMRAGFVLFDETPSEKPPAVPGPNEMLRADFDKLPGGERAARMKAGLRLIDGDPR